MQLRILQLSSNLRTKHIHLPLRIAQLTREERVPESFETFLNLQVVPGADFFLGVASIVISMSGFAD